MKKRLKRKNEKKIGMTNRFEASMISPDRNFSLCDWYNGRTDVSNYDLMTIYKRARYLYENTPEIKQAVSTLCLLMGTLTPRPASRDEEFNKLAREAFLKRALNARLFETTGRLNFFQAQNWIEKKAIIDGDNLTVMTRHSYDKGGGIALFAAPQICGTDDREFNRSMGVVMGKSGRIQKYLVKDTHLNKTVEIDANRAVLYGHSPDPNEPRTISELVTAICTAQDIAEINKLHKQQVKIGATFGLIETKNIQDKRSGLNDLIAARQARQNGEEVIEPKAENPLVIDGVKAISLEPGRDLKTLHNANPSNEVRAYVHDLINAIAYSVGIDPQVLFNPESLGSASTRFILAKAKDWARNRLFDREAWANRVYQHIIACEIESGRLRPCKYPDEQFAVNWINRTEWSIDLGHDTNSFISLFNNGLADANTWTLSHYDLTVEEIAERTAHDKAHIRQIAEKYGLPVEALLQNVAGATPVSWEQVPMPKDEHPEPNFQETNNE